MVNFDFATCRRGPFICSSLQDYKYIFPPCFERERSGSEVHCQFTLFAGSTGTLEDEIDAQITAKKAWKLILPGGSLDPEEVQSGIDVEVTENFPKVSIITMVAPSPDWFIGIDSLDMCDDGTWRESMNVTMLPPWDAGTEEGNQFSSSNAASSPHVNIFQITNDMPGAFNAPNPILSLGEFRFQTGSVGKTSVSFLVLVSATLMATLFL